jgi:DegV family protein with EDD domain
MSFVVFTDGCSNLPGAVLKSKQIRTLPFTYTINGEQIIYNGDIDSFDAPAHYNLLRAGELIQTSLANTQQFIDHFRPVLESGSDVVYIGMSSGISGTYQASSIAAAELMEEFPERRVRTVDSLGAGLGTGLLTIMAATLRDEGKTTDEAADILDRKRMDLCEFFTVDDLMFLRRTGRLSTTGALVGTMLNIKPILRGDEEGHIVVCQKCRGRKKAVDTLAQLYETRVVDPETQYVAISHGDCLEEAQALAEKICAIAQPKELIFCPHEPVTGSHVGPGMLAVFFFGKGR